jgi:hypothetical protein
MIPEALVKLPGKFKTEPAGNPKAVLFEIADAQKYFYQLFLHQM